MEQTKPGRIADGLELAAFIALLLYLAECAAGSSGRLISIGPLSLRMMFFAASFFLSLPAVLTQRKELVRNSLVISAVLLGIYLLIACLIGYKRGNPFGFIWGDLSGFLSLLLIPGFLAVFNRKERIETGLRVVFWSAAALGIGTSLCHFFLAFLTPEEIEVINVWINDRSLGGFALFATGIYRIYFKSQIFLQAAIPLGAWLFLQTKKTSLRILIGVTEGFVIFGMILSYTRGFWFGASAAAILLLILNFRRFGEYLKLLAAAVLTTAALFAASWGIYGQPAAVQEVIFRFDPDLVVLSGDIKDRSEPKELIAADEPQIAEEAESLVDINNQIAVSLRAESLKGLKILIRQHPVLGNGLGTNLNEVREDGKTEYMYLDVLMKTGIIGFILFLLVNFGTICLWCFWLLRHRKIKDITIDTVVHERNLHLLSAFLSIAITSYVNPFLTNPLGTAMLMLMAAGLFTEMKPNHKKSTEVFS